MNYEFIRYGMKTTLKPFVKSWGIKALLSVPIRKTGLTGSLPYGRCHHNVSFLQERYGGETVLGFAILEEDTFFWCIPHSVWKTPEGKYVDVTLKMTIETDETEYVRFAPLVWYDATRVGWTLRHEFRIYKDLHKGIEWKLDNGPYEMFTRKSFKGKDMTGLVFKRDYPCTETDSWVDYLLKLEKVVENL